MTERMTNVLAALRLEPQALPGILVPLALCTAVLELLAPRLKSDLGIQAAAPVQALIIVVAVLIAMVARELSGGVLDPVYDRLYGTERAVAPRVPATAPVSRIRGSGDTRRSWCLHVICVATPTVHPPPPGAPFSCAAFWLTERRRSRTDRAVGCTTATVLKTAWATGPVPLRCAG